MQYFVIHVGGRYLVARHVDGSPEGELIANFSSKEEAYSLANKGRIKENNAAILKGAGVTVNTDDTLRGNIPIEMDDTFGISKGNTLERDDPRHRALVQAIISQGRFRFNISKVAKKVGLEKRIAIGILTLAHMRGKLRLQQIDDDTWECHPIEQSEPNKAIGQTKRLG